MKDRKFRRIWGEPWDWYYLLNLERCKIKEMMNYINKTRRFEGYQTVVRDMQICIKLIDIVLEEDNSNNAYDKTLNITKNNWYIMFDGNFNFCFKFRHINHLK